MTIEYKNRKLIQIIIDMACTSDQNINEKVEGKFQKYQQLAYEIRGSRPGYRVEIVWESRDKKVLETDEKKMTRNWKEMLKTVLVVESESMVRKVLTDINITVSSKYSSSLKKIKKGGQQMVAYLDTTDFIILKVEPPT